MLIIILTLICFAQDKDNDRSIQYKQKTEIDFEGLEIDGELIKPQGSLVIDRKIATFNPLIKLRKDWNVEMSASVVEVK